MGGSWDRKPFSSIRAPSQAAVEIYDYFWAHGVSAVKCSRLPAASIGSPSVHAYAHHEVIPPESVARSLGVEMSRQRHQGGVLDAIRFRLPTEGPEMRMVDSFLAKGLPEPLADERLSVMVEPKVEGAFPDIVAAYWDPQTASSWSPARRTLTKADIRLLHLLYVEGGVGRVHEIMKRFRGRGVPRSIERLRSSSVIELVNEEICLRPLHEIFALKRLICIEAKVSSPMRAIDQAVRCTWFASDVYLLMPTLTGNESIRKIAALHGIGMILPDSSIDAAPVSSARASLPRSYASWMFNEWVWRLADDSGMGSEYTARY